MVKNFFKKKKDWSKLKDAVISEYLTPYIYKILYTKRPLIIIDCFAGKGQFDDGTDGSPIFIANHIKDVLINKKIKNKNIFGFFIESKYFKDLESNLKGYKNIFVLEGTFEQHIKKIISKLSYKNFNLFLYIDPYGIKSLDFNYLKKLDKNKFYSVEMLMNFNVLGFLREGARILKYKPIPIDEDDIDYETDDYTDINKMNRIANGDYWIKILKDKENGKIGKHEADELFAKEYAKRLNQIFKYTINIPIKKKEKNLPKYRLFFGTNHPDGLILMVDEMHKIWSSFLKKDRQSQDVFFAQLNFPNLGARTNFDLEQDILASLTKENILLDDIIILLIKKYGISFKTRDYINQLKELEKDKLILVERRPSKTKTGKDSKFWAICKREKKVFLRLNDVKDKN